MHVGVCEGVLDRLVLADGSGEDDPLAGVVGGSGVASAIRSQNMSDTREMGDILLQRCVAQAECFACKKTTFCVHAMEDLQWSV